MKKKIIILSTIIFSACVSETATRLPDGEIGHNIECSGVTMTWVDCRIEADEICPGTGAYTIISSNEEESEDFERYMQIKCGSEG